MPLIRESAGLWPRTVEFVIDDAGLAAAIGQRRHWQLEEHGAVYAPPGATGYVLVLPVCAPTLSRERYIATVICGGTALQTLLLPTAATSVAWSERRQLT